MKLKPYKSVKRPTYLIVGDSLLDFKIVKADHGLISSKGVFVCHTKNRLHQVLPGRHFESEEECRRALDQLLHDRAQELEKEFEKIQARRLNLPAVEYFHHG